MDERRGKGSSSEAPDSGNEKGSKPNPDDYDQVRLQVGWNHDWCSPPSNIVLKEVFKGPFPRARLVQHSPVVLLHKKKKRKKQCEGECAEKDSLPIDRCDVNLRRGIPDPWSEYLVFRGIRDLKGKLSVSDMLERVKLTEKVWKSWRVCMDVGIPDPWKRWPKPRSGTEQINERSRTPKPMAFEPVAKIGGKIRKSFSSFRPKGYPCGYVSKPCPSCNDCSHYPGPQVPASYKQSLRDASFPTKCQCKRSSQKSDVRKLHVNRSGRKHFRQARIDNRQVHPTICVQRRAQCTRKGNVEESKPGHAALPVQVIKEHFDTSKNVAWKNTCENGNKSSVTPLNNYLISNTLEGTKCHRTSRKCMIHSKHETLKTCECCRCEKQVASVDSKVQNDLVTIFTSNPEGSKTYYNRDQMVSHEKNLSPGVHLNSQKNLRHPKEKYKHLPRITHADASVQTGSSLGNDIFQQYFPLKKVHSRENLTDDVSDNSRLGKFQAKILSQPICEPEKIKARGIKFHSFPSLVRMNKSFVRVEETLNDAFISNSNDQKEPLPNIQGESESATLETNNSRKTPTLLKNIPEEKVIMNFVYQDDNKRLLSGHFSNEKEEKSAVGQKWTEYIRKNKTNEKLQNGFKFVEQESEKNDDKDNNKLEQNQTKESLRKSLVENFVGKSREEQEKRMSQYSYLYNTVPLQSVEDNCYKMPRHSCTEEPFNCDTDFKLRAQEVEYWSDGERAVACYTDRESTVVTEFEDNITSTGKTVIIPKRSHVNKLLAKSKQNERNNNAPSNPELFQSRDNNISIDKNQQKNDSVTDSGKFIISNSFGIDKSHSTPKDDRHQPTINYLTSPAGFVLNCAANEAVEKSLREISKDIMNDGKKLCELLGNKVETVFLVPQEAKFSEYRERGQARSDISLSTTEPPSSSTRPEYDIGGLACLERESVARSEEKQAGNTCSSFQIDSSYSESFTSSFPSKIELKTTKEENTRKKGCEIRNEEENKNDMNRVMDDGKGKHSLQKSRGRESDGAYDGICSFEKQAGSADISMNSLMRRKVECSVQVRNGADCTRRDSVGKIAKNKAMICENNVENSNEINSTRMPSKDHHAVVTMEESLRPNPSQRSAQNTRISIKSGMRAPDFSRIMRSNLISSNIKDVSDNKCNTLLKEEEGVYTNRLDGREMNGHIFFPSANKFEEKCISKIPPLKGMQCFCNTCQLSAISRFGSFSRSEWPKETPAARIYQKVLASNVELKSLSENEGITLLKEEEKYGNYGYREMQLQWMKQFLNEGSALGDLSPAEKQEDSSPSNKEEHISTADAVQKFYRFLEEDKSETSLPGRESSFHKTKRSKEMVQELGECSTPHVITGNEASISSKVETVSGTRLLQAQTSKVHTIGTGKESRSTASNGRNKEKAGSRVGWVRIGEKPSYESPDMKFSRRLRE